MVSKVEYIGRNILKMMPLPVYNPRQNKVPELEQFDEYSYGIGCYGMYYEFILKHHPDRADGKWADDGDISSYDENERLYLMLSLKLQDKDDEVVFSEEMYQELEVARTMLKARDARIIELACFSDLTTMEIAQQMKDEFDSDPSAMNRKELQTRISQWKNRALVRLSGIITAEKNKQLFPSLLAYVKNKKI